MSVHIINHLNKDKPDFEYTSKHHHNHCEKFQLCSDQVSSRVRITHWTLLIVASSFHSYDEDYPHPRMKMSSNRSCARWGKSRSTDEDNPDLTIDPDLQMRMYPIKIWWGISRSTDEDVPDQNMMRNIPIFRWGWTLSEYAQNNICTNLHHCEKF